MLGTLCVFVCVCHNVCLSQVECFSVSEPLHAFVSIFLKMELRNRRLFLTDSFFLVLLHWWWVGYIKLKQSWVRSLPDKCAFRVAMLEEGLRKDQMKDLVNEQ